MFPGVMPEPALKVWTAWGELGGEMFGLMKSWVREALAAQTALPTVTTVS